MAKDKEKKPALYARRLAGSEYVQNQLRDAATALGKAYRRAARERGPAVEDKKLYDHVREAVTSIRNATIALRRKPEPEPKRRGRKLVMAAVATGGVAMLAIRLGRQKNASEDPVASPAVSKPASEVSAESPGSQ